MNDILAYTEDTFSPKFNEHVVEGTGKEILELAPSYLSDIVESNMLSLKKCDLEYLGWRKLTVEEEYSKMFGKRESGIQYDIAKSNLYLVEYKYRYKGKAHSVYAYLPYANDGNLLEISDTMYHVVPVLSDTVISPSHREVFVRLLKDKLTFKRLDRNFIRNGEKVPGQIVYSNIFRIVGRDIEDRLGSMVPPVSLYLVRQFGLLETIRRYTGSNDVIITTNDQLTDSIKDNYNVYTTTGLKPRTLKENIVYKGHNLCICVNKNNKNINFLDNFIYGIIYTLDIFPNRADELIDLLSIGAVDDEKLFWEILLGRIIFKDSYTIDRIVSDLGEHFDALDSYLDSIIKSKLKEADIDVNTFYDLLAVIMKNFNIWLLNSKEYNSNIFNRYIDILYYILYDLIVAINRTFMELSRKSAKKELSESEVISIFNNKKNLLYRKIYQITKSKTMNICIALCDYSGDIKYPKTTSLLEDQSRGNGVRRGKQSQFPESTRTLKGQDLILGSMLFLTKKSPSPRFRTNLYLKYDIYTGRVTPDKDILDKANYLDKMLQGRGDASQVTSITEELEELD